MSEVNAPEVRLLGRQSWAKVSRRVALRTSASFAALDTRQRAQRAYASPFDELKNRDELFYEGTLSDVLATLENAIGNPGKYARPAIALHAARIIRAVLDWKTEEPEHAGACASLIMEASGLCESIYVQSPDALSRLNAFRAAVNNLKHGRELLLRPLVQEADYATFAYTRGKYSQRAAHALAKKEASGNILFIALGNGGIAAGMDTFIQYKGLTGGAGATFYAVRFSMYKKQDEKPKLGDDEVQHLKQLAAGKTVVIFDEDRTTGRTLDYAARFFNELFVDSTVIDIANSDEHE